jgi:DNA repair protein RecO (recombination protein O)
MYFSSQAIILKNRDYQEADRLVTMFTRRFGKLTAIARGVKKPKSSLRVCTQPFCCAQLYLYQGKSDLALLTQGQVQDFFPAARSRFDESLVLLYMMEALDQVLPEREPHERLFDLSLQAMQAVETGGKQPGPLRFFELSLLKELGYSPILEECVRCGASPPGHIFSVAEGGLICADCLESGEEHCRLTGETLAALRFLSRASLEAVGKLKISAAAWAELESLLAQTLTYHFERRFAVGEVLRGCTR